MKFEYRVNRLEDEAGTTTDDDCPHLAAVYIYEGDPMPDCCAICKRLPVTVLIRFLAWHEWPVRGG